MKARVRVFGLATAMAATGLAMATALTVNTMAAWTDDVAISAPATASSWQMGLGPMGGISAGNEATQITEFEWTTIERTQVCGNVHIAGTSATPSAWELDVDLTVRPFNGAEAIYLGVERGNPTVVDSTHVIVTGTTGGGPFNPGYNNALITEDQSAIIQICHYNTPAPSPGDAAMYEVAQVDGPVEVVDGQPRACTALTVTGLVTDTQADPFYFGWEATVDLTGVKAALAGAGLTPTHVQWSPAPDSGHNYTTTPADFQQPIDSYELVSGTTTTLRGTNAVTITACVHGQ